MEFCIDRVCSELERRNIPEMERGSTPEMEHGNIPEMERGNIPEMVAESYVPLHPPPLQGSDISALLTIMTERE